MLTGYFQKNMERLRKRAHEKYQGLSEEKKQSSICS